MEARLLVVQTDCPQRLHLDQKLADEVVLHSPGEGVKQAHIIHLNASTNALKVPRIFWQPIEFLCWLDRASKNSCLLLGEKGEFSGVLHASARVRLASF